MLDMGFREDIERILSALPAQRQALFFSATMPRAIQDLIGRYSRDPAWIRIESQAQNAPQVDQVYFEVDRRSKIEVLTRLIDLHDFRYGLIFCSTKVMVDELDEHLHARGYATDRLHGDLSQMQRNRVMEKFHRRAFEFLVATDVAARGLDVDDLEVVFNFDLPNDAEDYTHRIGRTGRAGKTGRAYTFVSGREIYKLQAMVRFAKLKIRRESVPSLDQVDEARANVFFEKLRSVLEAGKFQSHDRMVDRLLEQGYASTDICSALIELLKGGGAGGESGGAVAGPNAGAPAAARTSSPRPSGGARSTGPAAARSSAGPEAAGRKETRVAPRDSASRPDRDSGAGVAAGDAEGAAAAPAPDAPVVRRTGKEAGMTTLFFNVGRKQLATQAEIVGKIAGVTRLPAQVIGAIDLHQRHALVDVATEHAPLVLTKLNGVRVRGHSLKVALATKADAQLE